MHLTSCHSGHRMCMATLVVHLETNRSQETCMQNTTGLHTYMEKQIYFTVYRSPCRSKAMSYSLHAIHLYHMQQLTYLCNIPVHLCFWYTAPSECG